MDVRSGVSTFSAEEGLRRLADFPFALLTWAGADGYPVSTAVDASVDAEAGVVTFIAPAGIDVPAGRELSLTGSHIRPQPGVGYDERRHVTVWGVPSATASGRLAIAPTAAWGWDESSIPFPEYVERQVGQSRRYLARLSAESGRSIRPRLSLAWLTLRATRLPFLSATFIPVAIGLAIAAAQGYFDLFSAVLTIIGAAAVHLGLNVANDVFDTQLGADDRNINPTQFSGGSRVIQYGLVSFRGMAVHLGRHVRHRDRSRQSSCCATRYLAGVARDRRPRHPAQLLLHRAAAQARLSRPGRDHDSDRLRPAHARRRVRRADARRH